MHQFRTMGLALLSLLILLAGLCGCNDEDNPKDLSPSTFNSSISQHEAETPKEEESLPLRIISLAPSNTETLFALGLADRVVGVTEYCNYPPEASEKPKIGGFSNIDLEKVIELEPDLVLAARIHQDTVVPELEQRGIRVMTIAPETLGEVLETIEIIGTVTGSTEAAEQLVAEMQTRIDAITQKVDTLDQNDKPRVFYITWHDPIWTLGTGTITHELIETAGGINIMEDTEGHFETNLETILDRNPEVILASTGHGSAEDSPVNWALSDERLAQTDARVNGHVYEVDSDLVTRPGPRIVDGLELIAKMIHPVLFGE